jgi:hypothetical protein
LNSCGDTTICFTIPQSKFLLKKYYESIEYKKLDLVCEAQGIAKDSVVSILKLKCDEKDSIIVDDSTYILVQNLQIKQLNRKVFIEHREKIKQTAYKWIAIVVGSVVSFLEIMKK